MPVPHVMQHMGLEILRVFKVRAAIFQYAAINIGYIASYKTLIIIIRFRRMKLRGVYSYAD